MHPRDLFAGTPAKSLPAHRRARLAHRAAARRADPAGHAAGWVLPRRRRHHVETHHLTRFLVANDVASPSPATGLRGTFGDDGMTLSWTAGRTTAASSAARRSTQTAGRSPTPAQRPRRRSAASTRRTRARSPLCRATSSATPARRRARAAHPPQPHRHDPCGGAHALQQRGLHGRKGHHRGAARWPAARHGRLGRAASRRPRRERRSTSWSRQPASRRSSPSPIVAPKRVTARAGSRVPGGSASRSAQPCRRALADPRGRKLSVAVHRQGRRHDQKLQLPSSRTVRAATSWCGSRARASSRSSGRSSFGSSPGCGRGTRARKRCGLVLRDVWLEHLVAAVRGVCGDEEEIRAGSGRRRWAGRS